MNSRFVRAAILTALAAIALTGAGAEEMPVSRSAVQETGAGGGTMPAMPSSVLQVSGSTNNFVISAQHADVLNLLKLVFNQAHRQFVPDASVTGDVTFALGGQKLETVLDAICRQAFLRYDIDRNNIYQFRRDEQALRTFLVRTQLINATVQEQLRRMGYTVPQGSGAQDPGGAANAGGFGGGVMRRTAPPNAAFGRIDPTGPAGSPGLATLEGLQSSNAPRDTNSTGAAPLAGTANGGQTADAANRTSAKTGGAQNSDVIGQEGRSRAITQQQIGRNIGQDAAAGQGRQEAREPQDIARAAMPDLNDSAQYRLFLKQNNFVMFNTQEQDRPVRDVLLDLSRQSGVPIYIDPAVPAGNDFVINGYVTPRPLTEVLTYLAYKARLEWRWINNRVFVTTTPQLNLLLRGSPLPPPQSGSIPAPSRPNARLQQNAGSPRPTVPQAQSKPDAADRAKTKDKNER